MPERILPRGHRGGGTAGAEPAQQQQPRVEVTVRLDVRLPAPAAARRRLPVPTLHTSSAYNLFHNTQSGPGHSYHGVGRGARLAAAPISEADRFSKLHCTAAA
jgi:hypothetical protein